MTEMETEKVERGYLRGCFRFLLYNPWNID